MRNVYVVLFNQITSDPFYGVSSRVEAVVNSYEKAENAVPLDEKLLPEGIDEPHGGEVYYTIEKFEVVGIS